MAPRSNVSSSSSAVPFSRHILVTGGSGFVGYHLLESLLSQPPHLFPLIRTLDLNESTLAVNARLDSMIGDISDESIVMEACRGIDTVFHCAALTDETTLTSDCAADYEAVNVKGTMNVIAACLANDVKQLIYTSSSCVVFNGSDIKHGDEISCPYAAVHLDSYSRTKALAEVLVLKANGSRTKSYTEWEDKKMEWKEEEEEEENRRTNENTIENDVEAAAVDISLSNSNHYILSTIALRSHLIFGPRDTHLLPRLLQRARKGQITHTIGDGSNVCDWTYIDNVVYAHLLAMQRLQPCATCAGEAYFITNGSAKLFWSFVGQFLRGMGCTVPRKSISFSVAYCIAWLMELLRKLFGRWLFKKIFGFNQVLTRHAVCVMAVHCWFSNRKAARDLGYKPLITVEEGLQRTIEHQRGIQQQAITCQLQLEQLLLQYNHHNINTTYSNHTHAANHNRHRAHAHSHSQSHSHSHHPIKRRSQREHASTACRDIHNSLIAAAVH